MKVKDTNTILYSKEHVTASSDEAGQNNLYKHDSSCQMKDPNNNSNIKEKNAGENPTLNSSKSGKEKLDNTTEESKKDGFDVNDISPGNNNSQIVDTTSPVVTDNQKTDVYQSIENPKHLCKKQIRIN